MSVERLIWRLMMRMGVPIQTRRDVAHATMLKLYERTADYDPVKSKFITFASWVIRGAIGWELSCDQDFGPVNQFARKPERAGLFHVMDMEAPGDMAEEIERAQLQDMCAAEVMRLPLKERMAIMHTCNGETLASMGSAVGLSRERIRQLRERALAKVRKSLRAHA